MGNSQERPPNGILTHLRRVSRVWKRGDLGAYARFGAVAVAKQSIAYGAGEGGNEQAVSLKFRGGS